MRFLLGMGVLFLALGGLLWIVTRLGLRTFPGTLFLRRGGFVVWVPLGASLLLSIVLTVVLTVAARLFGR